MVWKSVPDFPDYEVSEHGDVRRGTKRLKPERVQGSGRKRFSFRRDGRIYRIGAHQLVAAAFIGPKPFEGAEVCHKDGFHHNNHFSNLRWDTHEANVVDAVKHKLQRRTGRTGVPTKSDAHKERTRRSRLQRISRISGEAVMRQISDYLKRKLADFPGIDEATCHLEGGRQIVRINGASAEVGAPQITT